jgi:hypothetical protein
MTTPRGPDLDEQMMCRACLAEEDRRAAACGVAEKAAKVIGARFDCECEAVECRHLGQAREVGA